MLVMKFGGASVKNAQGVKNVSQIILSYAASPLVVVVSAMDKTTNALERLAASAEQGDESAVNEQYNQLVHFHLQIVEELFGDGKQAVVAMLQPYFEGLYKTVQGIMLLQEYPPLMYDRIVAFGELLSTVIVAAFVKTQHPTITWLDARRCIKTDLQFGQAKVLWNATKEQVKAQVQPLLADGQIVLTQGFIAATLNGKTTTLGREGSDFSAAILAHCLDAESVTIWKDVPGVLNADPRLRSDARLIPQLSYEQAVEMTYYGATVIHPKTIQPLFAKKIPLFVRSFLQPEAEGTRIQDSEAQIPFPIFIHKPRQTLVEICAKDFSFMDARRIHVILDKIHASGIKITLSQHTARHLQLVIDHNEQILKELEASLSEKFQLQIQPLLALDTTLYYTPAQLTAQPAAKMMQVTERVLCVLS